MALVVRSSGEMRALTPAILQAIRDIDPEQPVYDYAPWKTSWSARPRSGG